MVRFKKWKDIAYGSSLVGASFAAYGAAYLTNSHLSSDGCDPGQIALLTLATKEAVYFTSNSILHALVCSPCYEDLSELKTDMKMITASNIGAMGFCTIAKSILHYGGMKMGIDPNTSMFGAYLTIGFGGTAIKLFMDFKKGVFGKKKEKTLEEKFS